MVRHVIVVLGMIAGICGVTTQSAQAASVVQVVGLAPTRTAVFIDSPAMGRVVQVQILHPAGGGSRPSYYLLDGLLPGEHESTWTAATDAERFFLGKNVNVVLPTGGLASYYTDWQRPDARFGNYKWETFLTKELPPIIDGQFGGNGVNGIAGLSMGGNSAYILAARNPHLYRAVAGFGACPDTATSTPAMLFSIALRGGDPTNMWGPVGSPAWREHDPAIMADRLRGKTLYLSSGTGIPGPHEFELEPELAENIITGGPVEAMVRGCLMGVQGRFASLGIPVHYNWRPTGSHSWSYWQDDLHDSWPVISRALGV